MKTKPNRKPVTLKFCAEEHRRGVSEGNAEGLAVYLTVMRDKEGLSAKKLHDIWRHTEHECTAISVDGALVARWARELHELYGADICPVMLDIAHAYKPPRQPINTAAAERCFRQGREAGWQFATLVFLRAIKHVCGYGVPVRLPRVYNAACELRDSIHKKYIKLADLETVLLEEAGIKVE